MFSTATYVERRNILKKLVKTGVVFFTGNSTFYFDELTPSHFRQDPSFVYYFGHNEQGLAAIIDIDNDKEIIFGNDRTIGDEIWMGAGKPTAVKAEEVGVGIVSPLSELEKFLKDVVTEKKKVHFLPQHKFENMILIEQMLGIHHSKINDYASLELIRSIVAHRSIKTDAEVNEIEKAVAISHAMNMLAFQYTRPGALEQEVAGAVEGMAMSMGLGISFPVIFSVNGHILHNHDHGNLMKEGQLAVLDSGAISNECYVSDITRTIPVSGTFTDKQKDIYNLVVNANLKGIEESKPGVLNRDVHLAAAKVIAGGLIDLGLMKGNIDDAVAAGAHALFFPHGLGHMLGMDAHDMEDLGENNVGYTDEIKRSDQFGLAFLRLARQLEPGFVTTIEPGIYFIPNLIDQWKAENKHTDFINYEKAEEYKDFGGIRIEDDILITHEGSKVLGPAIPKSVEEVEKACAGK